MLPNRWSMCLRSLNLHIFQRRAKSGVFTQKMAWLSASFIGIPLAVTLVMGSVVHANANRSISYSRPRHLKLSVRKVVIIRNGISCQFCFTDLFFSYIGECYRVFAVARVDTTCTSCRLLLQTILCTRLCMDRKPAPDKATAIIIIFSSCLLVVLYAGIARFRFYGYVLSPSC